MNNSPGNASEGTLLSNEQFLRQVAHLYYEVGENQERIAEIEACSRQTIGKALQRARERGIVRISVVPEERTGYLQNLSRETRQKLRLEDVVLISGQHLKNESDIADGVIADIATQAASYLDHLLTEQTILAVSGGKRIMRSVVRYLRPTKPLQGLQVVPTIGFVRSMANVGDANLIAFDIATAYGAEHSWLPIPALVENPEQCKYARSLPIVREVLKKVNEANVVVMELWPRSSHKKLVKKGVLRQDQVDILEAHGTVVDINHWAFDASGKCINEELTPPPYYLTGLEIPRLKERVKEGSIKAVLIAGGSLSYIPCIRAALNAGIANILITDHVTALLLTNALAKSNDIV